MGALKVVPIRWDEEMIARAEFEAKMRTIRTGSKWDKSKVLREWAERGEKCTENPDPHTARPTQTFLS